MRKLHYLIALFFVAKLFCAQDVFPSNTFVQTCIQKEVCFANQNSANLFYNEASNEFYVVVDFKKFKIGVDSLDGWLDDLDDTKFIFKGALSSDKLPALSNNGYKTLQVNGNISFNGVVHSYTIDLVLFKISPEGILYRNTGNDYYDRIRSNIQISFKIFDFKLNPVVRNIIKIYHHHQFILLNYLIARIILLKIN